MSYLPTIVVRWLIACLLELLPFAPKSKIGSLWEKELLPLLVEEIQPHSFAKVRESQETKEF